MADLQYCIKCMNPVTTGFCSECGNNNETYEQPPHHLAPGTILNNKYFVGASIGEGGFGITYVGVDTMLGIKVAIKEFFPNGFVSRASTVTNTVTVFTGSESESYEKGREKFLNEAKALAKFDSLPGIVSVKDFFYENNTAYIVMEFVEGITFKNFLKKNGGKLQSELVFTMMEPVIRSLSSVHKENIIHRDISPDNIMVTPDRQIKLIDFGAARETNKENEKSLSIQLKPGYAPEEQYRTKGEQGPWTDVYALCATIYKAITGITPPDALDRLGEDTLVKPSELGCFINKTKEVAVMRGLGIHKNERYANVDMLYQILYDETEKTVAMFSDRKQSYEQYISQKINNKTSQVPPQPVSPQPQPRPVQPQPQPRPVQPQPQPRPVQPQPQPRPVQPQPQPRPVQPQPQPRPVQPQQPGGYVPQGGAQQTPFNGFGLNFKPSPPQTDLTVCTKCNGLLLVKDLKWMVVLAIICIVIGAIMLLDVAMNYVDDSIGDILKYLICLASGIFLLLKPKKGYKICSRCKTKYE